VARQLLTGSCERISWEECHEQISNSGARCRWSVCRDHYWGATFDTIADGGFALLASVVFGLSAGLCIGGLIAANFAMLAVDEQPHQTASHAPYAELREAA